jgi:hypothetical protein
MFTVRPTRLWRPLLALRWPLASSSAGSPMAARSAAFEGLSPTSEGQQRCLVKLATGLVLRLREARAGA